MTMRRAVLSTLLLGAGLGLSGCETFDLESIWSSKKPLPGERRAVFPEGVPGVPQGVPPELVRGYQQPVEEPPPAQAAPPQQSSPWPDPQSRTVSQPQQSSPWPDPPRPSTR